MELEGMRQQLLNQGNSHGQTYKMLGHMTSMRMKFGEVVASSAPLDFLTMLPRNL